MLNDRAIYFSKVCRIDYVIGYMIVGLSDLDYAPQQHVVSQRPSARTKHLLPKACRLVIQTSLKSAIKSRWNWQLDYKKQY